MTTQNTQVQTTGKQETVADFILSRKAALAEIAPKYLNVERLIRLALSAYARNPDLAKCSKTSLLQFCIKCAETGTEKIGAGGAWPVAFWNNKLTPPQQDILFISDYRNMIRVARNAGVIKDAVAEVVYEKDTFHYTRGLHPELIHQPTLGDRGKLKFTYCVYELPDGRKDFRVLHEDDVSRRKRSSRAADKGPWKTHEPEMWKKTAVRAAMGIFEGSSKEMDSLLEADNDLQPIEIQQPVSMPKAIDDVTQATAIPLASDKPADTRTVQVKLAEVLADAGVSVDDALSFMQTKGLVQDASTIGGYDDLPDSVCEKIAGDSKMLAELTKKFGKRPGRKET